METRGGQPSVLRLCGALELCGVSSISRPPAAIRNLLLTTNSQNLPVVSYNSLPHLPPSVWFCGGVVLCSVVIIERVEAR